MNYIKLYLKTSFRINFGLWEGLHTEKKHESEIALCRFLVWALTEAQHLFQKDFFLNRAYVFIIKFK